MINWNITNIHYKKVENNEPLDNSFEIKQSILPKWLNTDSNPSSFPIVREDFSSSSLPDTEIDDENSIEDL